MRQVLLIAAVIWFVLHAIGPVPISEGDPVGELLKRLSFGLALVAAALIRWPKPDGIFGTESTPSADDPSPR
jgi:hypothetical protein